MVADDSIFFDRHDPAEDLYFRIGNIEPGAIVCALSPGGAEMAWPTAFLNGLIMVVVEPGTALPDARDRDVWLIDDGEAGDAALAEVAGRLLEAGAAAVDVACPVVSATFRRRRGRAPIRRVVALKWREDLPDGVPLYVFPPDGAVS